MKQRPYIGDDTQSLTFLSKLRGVIDSFWQTLSDCLNWYAGGESAYENIRFNHQGQECE